MKVIETFKGLTTTYYIRNFLFGLIFAGLFIFAEIKATDTNYGLIIFFIINTLLYPYSRFTYETVINYILGDNIFFTNIVLFVSFKIITMISCWMFAIFISPIGLIIIYFINKNQEKD